MRPVFRALTFIALAVQASWAARVEIAPETFVPSAPSAAAGAAVRLAPLSPVIAPLMTAAPLAVAPAAVPVAAAAAAPAAVARPTLIQSVSAPMPDLSRMTGGDSAAAAEKDFAARVQLGAPASAGTSASAESVPDPAQRALHFLKPAARPKEAPATDNLQAFGGVDHDGRLTRAALAALAPRPVGAELVLEFSPTPKSLQALAAADGVLLTRGRADGRWRLVQASAAGFAAPAEDYDLAVLGREGGRPTAADLRASEGRAARFAVVSERGIFEWNSDMPAGAGEALENTWWGRALARVAGRFYPRLLTGLGVAAERVSWVKTTQAWLDADRAPVAERQMANTVIPEWMSAELPVAAAKLGLALTPAQRADVLARSKVWVYSWHSRWSYEVGGGLPDGHYDPKFGIRVMLKTDWRKLKDPETHFRVLFAHEYTHWLQNEGLVTRRYGVEIPAVAVEELRAMELVGWEGMKSGRVGFIAEGTRNAFESGRRWAHGDRNDETAVMFRGVLGGVAYEVGEIAGRPEAAWEFLNLVIAEKGGLTPREAFERVTGLRK